MFLLFAFIKEWAHRKQLDLGDTSNAAISSNPLVISRIEKDVARLNENYGSWEKIKKIALLKSELSVESGELTPTLKLKRKIINEKFKSIIEGFYADED